MIKTLIVAISNNNAIGKGNDLPWYLPNDLKHFKKTTVGHHVIMGRKNYESIPERFRPLPDRVNIVMTTDKAYQAPECKVVHNMEEALSAVDKSENETFIIGGASIYEIFLPRVDKLIITEVDTNVDGADTFFPAINMKEWREIERESHKSDERNEHDHSFVVYQRV